MKKITSLAEYLDITAQNPKTSFYRGECQDFGESSCVAKANRDDIGYDLYSERLDLFNRKVSEGALLENPDFLIPFAQHSGLATRLLDITSNPLVVLYFACQPTFKDRVDDGHIFIFNDYADATSLLNRYPSFDLEEVFINQISLILEQTKKDIVYTALENEELIKFGEIIEQYRNSFIDEGKSLGINSLGWSNEDSLFLDKQSKLTELLESIRQDVTLCFTMYKGLQNYAFPEEEYNKLNTVDFLHPLKSKRYDYYNQQYRHFSLEVKEYLISLECLIAHINMRGPIGNMSSKRTISNTVMEYVPNLLFRPVMTFKRGLSQQSAFFFQSIFEKKGVIEWDGSDLTKPPVTTSRQMIKCKANFDEEIIIDGEFKKEILKELDKINVNTATMFGDADNIARYIMNGTEK